MNRPRADLDRRLRIAMWPIGLATVVVGELGFFIHHTVPRETFPLDLSVSTVSIVVGLILWQRRPGNRSGKLLVLAGLLWAVPGIRSFNNPWAFGFGEWLAGLQDVVFAHLLLAYPTGRLESTSRRVLVAVAYGLTVPGLIAVLVLDTRTCQCYPVRNAFGIWDNIGLHDAIHNVSGLIVAVLGITALILVGVQWWRASAVGKRAFTPVLMVGMAYAVAQIGDRLAGIGAADDPAWTFFPLLVIRIAIPVSFAYGLLRSQFEQAGVGDLVVRLHLTRGPASLRGSLAAALHDPSVELVYWVPDRGVFVDQDGHAAELPVDRPDRSVTRIELGDVLLGAIVHDPALLENPRLVQAATAAVSLSLDNERLAAELRAQIEEVRASRARIVDAGDLARRRIERDLHDGAQQRLLALALGLRMANDSINGHDPRATEALDAAASEMVEIVTDLRDLAQGIHPALLVEQGLGAAVDLLAERAPLPVEVRIDEKRYPAPIEAAAYFVVSEALTNVVKHARASRVDVAARRDGHGLVVEVSDDGVGGADPARGTGLLGLGDRVAAVDGAFDVESPPDGGTMLRAVFPCP